ncbi:Tar (HIV-1) RNA binding protein 1 [Globomyces sp. JEL0801]|nr:Tar (HIV-1) RNA binding protein 1 [Globomyces sp. JEL0801]
MNSLKYLSTDILVEILEKSLEAKDYDTLNSLLPQLCSMDEDSIKFRIPESIESKLLLVVNDYKLGNLLLNNQVNYILKLMGPNSTIIQLMKDTITYSNQLDTNVELESLLDIQSSSNLNLDEDLVNFNNNLKLLVLILKDDVLRKSISSVIDWNSFLDHLIKIFLNSEENRSDIGNFVFPLLIDQQIFDQKAHQHLDKIWKVLTISFSYFPPNHSIPVNIPGYICRLFDTMMGIDGTSFAHDRMMRDLRCDSKWGLKNFDTTCVKYSYFLLKRIVYFTENFNSLPLQPWTEFYNNNHNSDWDEYFLLFDIAQEPSLHLVEGQISKFGNASKNLHSTWFTILLERGTMNFSAPIRKKVLEYILSIKEPKLLRIIGTNWEYLSDLFIKYLDKAVLYSVPGLGSFVSPFGNLLSEFLIRIVKSYESNSDLNKFYKLIINLLPTFTSRVPIIFVLQGLSDGLEESGKDMDVLSATELLSIIELVSGTRSISMLKNMNARTLISSYFVNIIVRLLSPITVEFDLLCSCVGSLFPTENPLPLGSTDWKLLNTWLAKQFPDRKTEFHLCVKKFIESGITNFSNFNTEEKCTYCFGVMLRCLLTDDEVTTENLQLLVEPLQVYTSKLFQPYTNQELQNRILRTLRDFMEPFRQDKNANIQYPLDSELIVKVIETLNSEFIHPTSIFFVNNSIALVNIDILLQLVDTTFNMESTIKKSTKIDALMMVKISAFDCMTRILANTFKYSKQSTSYFLSVYAVTGGLSLASTISKHLQYQLYTTNDLQLINQLFQIELSRPIDADSNLKSILTDDLVLKTSLLNDVVMALENATWITAHSLLNLLSYLLNEITEMDHSLIERGLVAGLRLLEESWTASRYWTELVDAYCKFAFHEYNLTCEELSEPMEMVWKKFHVWCESRVRLMQYPATQVYKYWAKGFGNQPNQIALKSLNDHVDWVVDMCLFGPLRDQDVQDQKHEAMIALKVFSPTLTKENIEEMKGVQANDLLISLDINNTTHQQIAWNTIESLLKISDQNKLKAKFINTLTQRKTMRMWMSFHLLVDFIPQSECSMIFDRVMGALLKEYVSESRVWIEWIIIRLLIRFHDELVPKFWKFFENLDLKANISTALVTITLHAGKHSIKNRQESFMKEALTRLLPWISSNHFNIRVVAQLTVIEFWKHLIENDYKLLLEQFAHVGPIVDFMKNRQDVAKQIAKCNDFYFIGGDFHPLDDLNLEFLFRGSLTFLGCADDEKISCTAFAKVNPDMSRRIPFGISVDNESEKVDTSFVESTIQRKIIPWERLMETDIDLSSDRVRPNQKRNPLIIVATLVSKLPNLGGLCRTCETFNLECLVVSNLNIKTDPQFFSTCVSAERWMPMKQVQEIELEQYLMEMKTLGYSLIGLEQATRSVPLDTFKFPKKSLILLGKEREGIPTHLLPMMDYIVEIPQFGVIRSLNVHVSGSMIMWEYIKQHQC